MSRLTWSKLLDPTRTRDVEQGPKHDAPAQPDARAEFERDYDRSLFSSPVRRLQDKTQVFPLDPSDAVRTRLTHSLEVSGVARGLATQVGTWLEQRRPNDGYQPDMTWHLRHIAMTSGLLHDLGNPPFGHAGEDAIQSWFMRKLGERVPRSGAAASAAGNEPTYLDLLGGDASPYALDFLRFEGNAQTLRLVAHLQMLSDRHGLNLTCATFATLAKYTAASNQADRGLLRHDWAKPGYYQSERGLVEDVRGRLGLSDARRHPLAFLVEAADDTVYSTVDLEDGVRKGVLTWATLSERLLASDAKEVAAELLAASDKYVVEGGLNLIGHTADEARVQIFRTRAIGTHVRAAFETFCAKYDAIMEGSYHGELLEDGPSAALLGACKDVARTIVYPNRETLRLEVLGREVIHSLMDRFWEGAEHAPHGPTGNQRAFRRTFPGKVYDLFSGSYRRLFEEDVRRVQLDVANSGAIPTRPSLYSAAEDTSPFAPLTADARLAYHRLQLVADYVSGMTDTFAITLHRQLTSG